MKKTYLVGGFFYRIIKAHTPPEAWFIYVTEDINMQKVIWGREDARQELSKRGFKKLQPTTTENVCEVFK